MTTDTRPELPLSDALRLVRKANRSPRAEGTALIAASLGIDLAAFCDFESRETTDGTEFVFRRGGYTLVDRHRCLFHPRMLLVIE